MGMCKIRAVLGPGEKGLAGGPGGIERMETGASPRGGEPAGLGWVAGTLFPEVVLPMPGTVVRSRLDGGTSPLSMCWAAWTHCSRFRPARTGLGDTAEARAAEDFDKMGRPKLTSRDANRPELVVHSIVLDKLDELIDVCLADLDHLGEEKSLRTESWVRGGSDAQGLPPYLLVIAE
jgi:hypothetical protein